MSVLDEHTEGELRVGDLVRKHGVAWLWQIVGFEEDGRATLRSINADCDRNTVADLFELNLVAEVVVEVVAGDECPCCGHLRP